MSSFEKINTAIRDVNQQLDLGVELEEALRVATLGLTAQETEHIYFIFQ